MQYIIMMLTVFLTFPAQARQERMLPPYEVAAPVMPINVSQQPNTLAKPVQSEHNKPTKSEHNKPAQSKLQKADNANNSKTPDAEYPHKHRKEKADAIPLHNHKDDFHKEPVKKSGVYVNLNLSAGTPVITRRTAVNPPVTTVIRPVVYENNIYTNNAYTCRSVKELKYCTDYRGKALNGRIVQNYGDNVAYEHYKNGYQSGETNVFSADGSLVRKTNYKKSRKHGQEKVYYANGKVEYAANYKQGALEGTVLQYNINGKQIGRMTYHNGRMQSRSCRYETKDTELLAQIKQKNYNELILCGDGSVY
ncbi:MAG: hypothetical protein IJ770_01625 [Alphaproteobacteria bacterium]|nr:hypothetical protein [Alphaproteobacteria bacterium]